MVNAFARADIYNKIQSFSGCIVAFLSILMLHEDRWQQRRGARRGNAVFRKAVRIIKQANDKEGIVVKKKFVKSLALLLTLVLCMALVCSCGGGGETPGGSDQPAGDSDNSGGTARDTVIAGVTADPPSLAPDAAGNQTAQVIYTNIYNRLVELNDDGEYVCQLAESYEVSEDGLAYTFHLRDDVVFHNGQPFTAEDVQYTLDRYSASSTLGVYFTNYDRTEIIDDYTCVVYYSAPYSGTSECLFSIRGSNILDKTTCEELGVDMNTDPIGTGPFQYVSRTSGDKIELKRFEDYWGEKPKYENLIFKVIADETSAAIALESGEIDCMYQISITNKDNISNNPALAWYETPSAAVLFCRVSTTNEVTQDVRVRQAIQYAIDKQGLIDIVAEGEGVPASVLFSPAGTGYPEGFPDVERDVEKAKQLLAEAGYPDGVTLYVATSQERPLYYNVCQAMQGQLAEAGIDLQLSVTDAATMFDVTGSQHKYQLFVSQEALTAKDNNTLVYRNYHSDYIANGGPNSVEWNNPEADALLDAMIAEFDVAKRSELYWQFSELVQQEVPAIPLYIYNYYFAADANLKGVELTQTLILDCSTWYWAE